MNFPLACGWVLCLLLSFAGYGWLVLRLCGWQRPGWSLSAAIGVCFFVALGGLLNMAHAIQPAVIVPVVAAGVLLALRSGRRATRPQVRASNLLLTLALLVPILGNVCCDVRSFNLYDDLPAYLTIPTETLQLHALPADPFNERRVTSCLGASYFLQACLLAGREVREYRAMDVSLGWVLYGGLLFQALGRIGLERGRRIAVTALILLVPVFRINMTFVILPAALFCALYLILTEPEQTGRRRAIPLAFVAASLCALKSNYLPAAVLICGLFYAGDLLLRRQKGALAEGLLWACGVVLILLPWMIDLHAKEGTYLFPVLGRGYDASAYGAVPLPNGSRSGLTSAGLWVWITTISFAGPYLLALALLWIAGRHRLVPDALPMAAMLSGTALAIASLSSSTGGESIGRYSLPFQVPVLLLFLAHLLQWGVGGTKKALWWKCGITVVGGYVIFLAALFGIKHGQYRSFLEDAHVLTPTGDSWFDPAREIVRIGRLQASIPEGESVLARVFVSYPFDFRRNRIYVADYTGMAGLPPGIPVNQPAAAIRDYLVTHGIRYLVYDYRRTMLPDDDPGTSLETVLADPARYGRHGWLYMQVKVTNSEQNLFAQLGSHYHRVYDDGEVFVLNLAERRVPGSTTQ